MSDQTNPNKLDVDYILTENETPRLNSHDGQVTPPTPVEAPVVNAPALASAGGAATADQSSPDSPLAPDSVDRIATGQQLLNLAASSNDNITALELRKEGVRLLLQPLYEDSMPAPASMPTAPLAPVGPAPAAAPKRQSAGAKATNLGPMRTGQAPTSASELAHQAAPAPMDPVVAAQVQFIVASFRARQAAAPYPPVASVQPELSGARAVSGQVTVQQLMEAFHQLQAHNQQVVSLPTARAPPAPVVLPTPNPPFVVRMPSVPQPQVPQASQPVKFAHFRQAFPAPKFSPMEFYQQERSRLIKELADLREMLNNAGDDDYGKFIKEMIPPAIADLEERLARLTPPRDDPAPGPAAPRGDDHDNGSGQGGIAAV